MSQRYQDLQVEKGVYIPQVGIDYPDDDPYARLYQPRYVRKVVVDEHYRFVNDSRLYQWMRKVLWCFILEFALNIYLRVRMGLRFKGREHLEQYKDELKNGAITISNHMLALDCPCILLATRAKYTMRIPMYAPNFATLNNIFLHIAGGIPIPPAEAGLAAVKKFNEAFDEFARRGYWFHIFPEASRWNFYKPIRPFQKGAFSMAYKYNRPILPCVISYRERRGIYRLFAKKEIPLLQVEIGAPIMPDRSRPRGVEVDRLRDTAHQVMTRMAGITYNPWPSKPDKE